MWERRYSPDMGETIWQDGEYRLTLMFATEQPYRGLETTMAAERALADRFVACVNACALIPTEDLESGKWESAIDSLVLDAQCEASMEKSYREEVEVRLTEAVALLREINADAGKWLSTKDVFVRACAFLHKLDNAAAPTPVGRQR